MSFTLTQRFEEIEIRNFLKLAAKFSLISTAFLIPLSTSLSEIFFPLTVLLYLCCENPLPKLTQGLKNPIVRLLIVYYLLYVIGTTYTIAFHHEIFKALNKQACFIMSAILICMIDESRARQIAINAFLFAIIISLTASYIKYLWEPHWLKNRFDSANVFKNHIDQGFLLAYAAFIFLYRYIKKETRFKGWYGIICLLTLFNLIFINSGRSGYLIFIPLACYTGFRCFNWKGLLVFIIATFLLFILAFTVSPFFKERILDGSHDLKSLQSGEGNTSLGIRLISMKNAWNLIKEKPIFGHGTGSFYAAYSTLPTAITKDTDIMKASYNNYLNVGVELGVVGILVLLIIFGLQFYYSFQLTPEWSFIIHALLLSLMVGCLINPWLSDTTELHAYALIIALGFSVLCPGSTPSYNENALKDTRV